VVSAQSDAQKQRGLVENMLTQGVDAMVITPVDINTAAQLFKMAKDAGIPTVDYNFVVPNSGADYVVARDAREFGRITAKQVLKDRPTGNYVIVSGDEGNSVARDTQAGYLDVLQPEIDAKRITVVSQQFNKNWDPQNALQQTEQALVKAHNAVDAVLVGNDGMAGGVMQALKAQGLLGKVVVSGIDADLANVQAIAKGEQSLTIWTDFAAMGEAAAKAADAAARKKTLPGVDGLRPAANGQPPTVIMPTIVVDKSNICEWTTKYKYYTVDQVFGANASSCK
jgi:D-xylose transport system substrate-binding protein